METLLNLPVWLLNGFLVILYAAVERWVFLILAGLLVLVYLAAPVEQRPLTLGALGLALAAGLLAPNPIPFFLLAITGTAIVMGRVEKYNRPAVQWQAVQALGLYSLIGLGLTLALALGLDRSLSSDPLSAQGAGYLKAIAGIAMYAVPVMFMAWQAKSIWAHPPAPGTPKDILTTVRTRGK